MIKIAEAGNTENPALLVIKNKGYHLAVRYYACNKHNVKECNKCDFEEFGNYLDFVATKDGNTFIGESGPSLLGLIAIWENRGADWQTRDGEDFLLGSLPEEA